MTSSRYLEIAVHCGPEHFDDIVGALTLGGCTGFWEDGTTIRCYVDRRLRPDIEPARLQETITSLFRNRDLAPPRMEVGTIEQQNWNEDWERSITPIRVSRTITVCPSWSKVREQPGHLVLVIDPKMSFGTGFHETTRLMLRLMERNVAPGSRVLDIGCGTGILTIAAVKMGATYAVGVDIDDWSILNAGENATRNGVGAETVFLEGDIAKAPAGSYQLILANIQLSVLLKLLEPMKVRLATGGLLILSGLLTSDRLPMTDSLRAHGFRLIAEEHEGEWIGVAATTTPP